MPILRITLITLVTVAAVPVLAQVQEPSIDRLLRKLPKPEKLAGPSMKAMPSEPASNDPLGQRAIMHANRGEYRSAIECCRQLEAKYPNTFGSYCVHGLAAWAGGAYQDAAAAFSKAVAIKPNAAYGHFGLALVELTQGHYNAALPHFQQMARLEPNEPIIYYYMSEIAWVAGRSRESYEYAQKTASLAPSEWVAWAQVARGAASLGDKPGTVKAMSRAAEVSPDNPLVLGMLGISYMNANQFAQGLSTLQKAQHLGLKEFVVESEIGHCMAMLGQVDAGIDHMRKGTRKESGYAPGWLYLGLAYQKQGLHQDAAKSFERATRLAPKWPEPWQSLAGEYQALGRATDAEKAAAHVRHTPALSKKKSGSAG
jgi:tetratricopeptide (TPR) repeat protein